ncbi:MAG: hypothetical protein M1831_002837 [Alyxoria varia]|nr:MAG: hypothetical protein M1831_002837 [Alyxoria varia]
MPQSSYYKNNLPGESLQRARQQYIVPNALLGSSIFGFAIGVYILTLKAVSQDEFEDVPVPDRPAPTAGAPHMSANKSAGSTSVGT